MYSLICVHCTVENCLQLLQNLIDSLLMLLINIVGVVTCSDNLSRVSLDLFSIHFVITLHSSIAATSALRYKKKLKFNRMLSILVMSCNFMSCNLMLCNFDGPSFSAPQGDYPCICLYSGTQTNGIFYVIGSQPGSTLPKLGNWVFDLGIGLFFY